MTSPAIRTGFRFGRFELDLRARELRKDQVRLRLQDQPFEVLVRLLERPGEVLTREELRQRLWPEGTFVDFEHGLNAAVKRLRAALGDNADRPRFVETLHRRGYRFVAPVDRIEAADPHAGSHSDGRIRLAVLPFTSPGDQGGQEYFVDGLAEEMITELGRVCSDRLGVVARTSSMLVRRSAHTAREIGQALQVGYLVEGSVRREADRVRIGVQLIETRGETELWAESYERQVSDGLHAQSQIASEIAQALAMQLVPESRVRRGSVTRHSGAHQAYVKGRYHWNRPAAEGIAEAVFFFEQALALDPDFAPAHAALGRAHVVAAEYYIEDPRAALESGRVAASRALDIDPGQSDAHLALAEIRKSADRDWAATEAAYTSALTVNPSNAAAHRLHGLFLAARGRAPEAMAAVQRACDLDPLCLVVHTSAAWVRYLAREYDEAIGWCRHTLDMDAHFAPARRVLAAALIQIGRLAEAVSELEQAAARRGDWLTMMWLAHGYAVQGDRDRARQLVRSADTAAYASPYHLALAEAGIGDRDEAVRHLHAALEARDPAIVNLPREPRFDVLRDDPRHVALVRRLGL